MSLLLLFSSTPVVAKSGMEATSATGSATASGGRSAAGTGTLTSRTVTGIFTVPQRPEVDVRLATSTVLLRQLENA